MSLITERIEAYGLWRHELVEAVEQYRAWLGGSSLSDGQLQGRLDRVVAQLREDRMTVAFVAEFSRGKSELINAIFFAQYRQRIVPSSAGRTTMCPTELMFDAALPVGIRLLPIETRLEDTSIADLKMQPGRWTLVPVDPAQVSSLKEAFAAVRETRRVPAAMAQQMGLYDEDDLDSPWRADAAGMVEVPAWRHATVNFPHPLLQQGLVIVDTPGLNAVGAEPELTLNLIPSAHAVLFLLSADTGVTRSDIEVWREHINPSHRSGRFVVLNKIDGLWDELKSEAEINLEIAAQVSSVGRLLELPSDRIFPVSAQKGLVGKVQGDAALLRRSRLPDLEQALSGELVPRRLALVREQVGRDFRDTVAVTRGVLDARLRNLVEQTGELSGLRGRNKDVIEQMSGRIRGERDEFEQRFRQLQALRAVFTRHVQSLKGHIGLDNLRRHVGDARELMRASRLSTQLRDGMAMMIASVRIDFSEADKVIVEISAMMTAMYSSFGRDYGMELGEPPGLSLKRYFAEIERLQQIHERQFGVVSLLTVEKYALTRRFFESVVSRFRDIYVEAAKETENWTRALMAPIESQVREHQTQLRRRLDAVQRVMDASDSLDDRLEELGIAQQQIAEQIDRMSELARAVTEIMDRSVAAQADPVSV